MAHSAFRARFVTSTLCAGLLSGSALFVTACNDAARSPTAPPYRMVAAGDEGGPSTGGGGSGGSTPCNATNHYCQQAAFLSGQLSMINAAASHLSQNCPWVMPYLNGLSSNGGYFGYSPAVVSPDWADTHTPKGLDDSAYPYNKAEIHLGPKSFANGTQQLAITLAHEASHGYMNSSDNPGDWNSGEQWGQYCYTP